MCEGVSEPAFEGVSWLWYLDLEIGFVLDVEPPGDAGLGVEFHVGSEDGAVVEKSVAMRAPLLDVLIFC
jgi:hypothetical protein